MTNPDAVERLYQLLPDFYRDRDALEGEPLRALMSVLELAYGEIETSVRKSLDNWFVETCEPPFLPPLGDLVGLRGLEEAAGLGLLLRSRVGNAIAHRRGKGTAIAFEAAARAATGWQARVVEYLQLTSVTQHLSEPGRRGALIDLRKSQDLETLDTPFETSSHTANLRGSRRRPSMAADTAPIRGKYNPPFLGVALWRMTSYPAEWHEPRALGGGRYMLNPFGVDSAVFNPAGDPESRSQRLGPEDVAAALTRRVLASRLRAKGPGDGRPDPIEIWARFPGESSFRHMPSEAIAVQDLANWGRAVEDGYGQSARGGEPPLTLDPETGRLRFAGPLLPDAVRVNYCWGFPANLGGGPYARQDAARPVAGLWESVVSDPACPERLEPAPPSPAHRPAGPCGSPVRAILEPTSANVSAAGGTGSVLVTPWIENETWTAAGNADWITITSPVRWSGVGRVEYEVAAQPDLRPRTAALQIAGQTFPITQPPVFPSLRAALENFLLQPPSTAGLVRLAGNCIHTISPDAAPFEVSLAGRVLTIEAMEGCCPAILGDLVFTGAGAGSSVTLRGLRLAGSARFSGNLEARIDHCTIGSFGSQPRQSRRAALAVSSDSAPLAIEVIRSIVGPIRLDGGAAVSIRDSIVDGGGDEAISSGGGLADTSLTVERSTIFGGARVTAIDRISEAIFTGPLHVVARESGCVRFSYIPPGSRAPAQRHCVPQEMRPLFASLRYGDPAYGQLSINCPRQFLRASEENDEIGAFQMVRPGLRLRQLEQVLEEFTPVGLECVVFFAN